MGRTKNFNRDETLDKAVDLFWDQGYADTSASDLVSHLGLSRSSLYDTFGDKRSLYLETLKRYQEKMALQFEILEAQHTTTESLARFLFESSVQHCQQTEDFRGCYMVNTAIDTCPTDVEVWDIVQANQKSLVNQLQIKIENDQAHGTLSPDKEPQALAQFLFSALSGFRVMLKPKTPVDNLQAIIELNLSVLK